MRSAQKAQWKNIGGLEDAKSEKPALFDVAEVAAILQHCARQRRAISYSEILMALGYRFSRPKMRALCVVLDTVDLRGAARDEPELAVLVVRESDKLPGQGWWVGRVEYQGLWVGPEAFAYVRAIQNRTFDYWQNTPR